MVLFRSWMYLRCTFQHLRLVVNILSETELDYLCLCFDCNKYFTFSQKESGSIKVKGEPKSLKASTSKNVPLNH